MVRFPPILDPTPWPAFDPSGGRNRDRVLCQLGSLGVNWSPDGCRGAFSKSSRVWSDCVPLSSCLAYPLAADAAPRGVDRPANYLLVCLRALAVGRLMHGRPGGGRRSNDRSRHEKCDPVHRRAPLAPNVPEVRPLAHSSQSRHSICPTTSQLWHAAAMRFFASRSALPGGLPGPGSVRAPKAGVSAKIGEDRSRAA
jgi:hypothetical protein